MNRRIDGSANIKALIIGGPGAGKTRMSSYWPKPIFLDCENGRGSLADRKADLRQKMLNEELNHRVKNILALIKSVVSQPIDPARDLTDYVASLKGRIMALA